jgi:hypothetical protein
MAIPHALYLAQQTPLDFTKEAAPERVRPNLSLLARVEELDLLVATVEALDDEDLTPELRAELELDLTNVITGTRDKVDSIASVLARFAAAEEAAATEIARLTIRKRYMQRQRERLEGYTLAVLAKLDRKKLEGHTATLAARNNPPSIHVEPDATLDPRFLRHQPPPPPVPDKGAIKAALQRGEDVPGAYVVQGVRLVVS